MDDVSFLSKFMDWVAAAVTAYAVYIHNKLSNTNDSLTALKLKIAEEYVTSNEHDKAIDRVSDKLDLILEKLDKKADKQ